MKVLINDTPHELAPNARLPDALQAIQATPPFAVAVNREFLLHALTAGARDELLLEVGAPTAPLAIRRPDDEHTFSLLMPVRLEG